MTAAVSRTSRQHLPALRYFLFHNHTSAGGHCVTRRIQQPNEHAQTLYLYKGRGEREVRCEMGQEEKQGEITCNMARAQEREDRKNQGVELGDELRERKMKEAW